MLNKSTLTAVGVTLGVLAVLNNVRALRSIKRTIVG